MLYDKNGKLTRAGAIQVIQSGGSVSIGGHIYGSVATLPNEADFAKGDAAAENSARERLQQQINDAQAQLQKLSPGKVEAVASTGDDLESKTSDELKALAKERKIDHYWTMSNEKLIAALRA